MKTCILVIGCYRSGTSAAAGVLHHLGVDMGSNFDEPNQNNSSGFWEDVRFKSLHARLLEGQMVRDEYCQLINEKHDIWGIKDPKLCHCFPFVVQCLDECKWGYKVVDCNRDVAGVADSICRATSSESPEFWVPHVENYLRSKQSNIDCYGGPLLKVYFDDLKDPYHYVESLASFSGLSINKQAIEYIRNHV